MIFTPELVEEIKLLTFYTLESTQEGIKVHKAAGETAIAAAQRLHAKGLISQSDGGYLTSQGIEAAEHARALLTILSAV